MLILSRSADSFTLPSVGHRDLKDASRSLRAGFTSEFVERPDGYPGLSATYGFQFGQVVELDPGLMYSALANGQVDVICAFATDGRLAAHGLRVLKDDKSFFPPYEAAPAVTALVLYALLPIILNTYTGLNGISPGILEAADGIGMSSAQRLRIVELPLALPVIIAGVRTAAVWTVGIATLSTYIGAGGLGDFISRGLARNDPRLTLLGAVPAAGIAVLLSAAIRSVERRSQSRGNPPGKRAAPETTEDESS